MKAVIVSDSHNNFGSIRDIIEKERQINLIIHAGDVQRDVEDIERAYPMLACAAVLGNNDFFVRDMPYDRVFTFGNKKIFLTHGHRYGVKQSLLRVRMRALEEGADICIFGHTHIPYCENINGIWMVNPGTSWRTYALLEIDEDNIKINIKDR